MKNVLFCSKCKEKIYMKNGLEVNESIHDVNDARYIIFRLNTLPAPAEAPEQRFCRAMALFVYKHV
jgi:hypothetical protein